MIAHYHLLRTLRMSLDLKMKIAKLKNNLVPLKIHWIMKTRNKLLMIPSREK
jgi:hypothetical protein